MRKAGAEAGAGGTEAKAGAEAGAETEAKAGAEAETKTNARTRMERRGGQGQPGLRFKKGRNRRNAVRRLSETSLHAH